MEFYKKEKLYKKPNKDYKEKKTRRNSTQLILGKKKKKLE